MPKGEIDKFISACSREEQRTLAESVRAGPTLWMLGAPAPAPEGMVGLATSATQTVYFRREEVLDARETGGRFLIRVSTDTNLLVREEQVVRLDPGGCQCKEPPGTMARKGGGERPPGPIIIDCPITCSFETVCEPFREPFSGAVIMVCWPKIVCRNACDGGQA